MKNLDMVKVRLVPDYKLHSDVPITSSTEALDLLRNELTQFDREVICVLNLNAKGKPINASIIAMGDITSAALHPRELFKCAILSSAAGFVLIHNHPSGDLVPSEDDILVTSRLISGAKLLGIRLIDHIVGMDIPKQMLEIWDVSVSDIDRAAAKNTAELFLPKLRDCNAIIEEGRTGKTAENLLERSKPVEEGVMFSLSNTAAMMGASACFYPGIHDKVRSLVGDDYYVIPLNVEEVVIAPKKNVPDGIRNIEKMLWASNMLAPEKLVLSDVIFEYTQKDRMLKPAWEQNRKSRDFER